MQFAMGKLPKCMGCQNITPWRVEPIFTTIHIVVAILLLFFFGFGLLYILIIAIVRSNPESRAKICPCCGTRNMWTFVY
jgi:hypothetical protein